MPEIKCDHTSVGMIVKKDDQILLIERMKLPYGFALPAGHVDDHGSYEDAARDELREEVGLNAQSLRLIVEGKKDNPCRREDGTWHYWKIYQAIVTGEIRRSQDETKQAGWYKPEDLEKLAERTRAFLSKNIPEQDWQQNPGLEPVWYEWFKELRIID